MPILPPSRSPRGDEGPFWTRQLALGPEGRICPELQESLDAFDAERTLTLGEKNKSNLWIIDTLQVTNISPKNGILKMIFLFPRRDMLIPWRVIFFPQSWFSGKLPQMKGNKYSRDHFAHHGRKASSPDNGWVFRYFSEIPNRWVFSMDSKPPGFFGVEILERFHAFVFLKNIQHQGDIVTTPCFF